MQCFIVLNQFIVETGTYSKVNNIESSFFLLYFFKGGRGGLWGCRGGVNLMKTLKVKNFKTYVT